MSQGGFLVTNVAEEVAQIDPVMSELIGSMHYLALQGLFDGF